MSEFRARTIRFPALHDALVTVAWLMVLVDVFAVTT